MEGEEEEAVDVAGMLQGMLTFNAIIVENLDILSELVLI
jgi:hypothetical protein